MRAISVLGLGLAAALMAGRPAAAAGDKIAVVQLEQLMKLHPDTAPAEAMLDKQRQEFEAERVDMLKEMDKKKAAFDAAREEADDPALKDEARQLKLKALQAKYVALREYDKDIQEKEMDRQKELNDHGKRLRERIIGKIHDVVQAYADEKGYALVLVGESSGVGAFGAVMYNSPKLDITDEIRAIIEKQAKQAKQDKAPAKP